MMYVGMYVCMYGWMDGCNDKGASRIEQSKTPGQGLLLGLGQRYTEVYYTEGIYEDLSQGGHQVLFLYLSTKRARALRFLLFAILAQNAHPLGEHTVRIEETPEDKG